MDIEKITVWDGTRFRKAIGKVMTTDGLKDFYRPITFETDFITTNCMIWQAVSENQAVIIDDKLFFDTKVRYDVWPINDNLIPFENPSTWGLANIINYDGYYEVTASNDATSWGLITDRGIGVNFKQNQEYTISFEIKSDNLEVLRYNYLISDSGNMRIDNLTINKPSDWTKFSITFISTDKDRINAGVLLGADLRNEPNGVSYFIRDVKIEIGTRAT